MTVTESTPHPESSSEPEFTITTQSLTPEEIAAVTAVVQDALARESEASFEHDDPGPSGWARSRRALRDSVHPGPGEWRRG